MATPGAGPPSYTFPSQPPSYRSHQGAGTPSETGSLEIDRERMDVLVRNFHGSIGVLYSEKNTLYKQLASSIKGYYSTSLFFSGTEIINYDDSSWLEKSARYKYLIFVGVPQTKRRATRRGKSGSLDATSREEAIMSQDYRKLSSVVVINPAMPRGKTEKGGQFLERFVHLPLRQSSDLTRLAQTAFAIFSGKRRERERERHAERKSLKPQPQDVL